MEVPLKQGGQELDRGRREREREREREKETNKTILRECWEASS